MNLMRGIQVRSLVLEDSTCHEATKSVGHNCWTHMLQLLKSTCLEPVSLNKRSRCNEKPAHHN